MAHGLNSVLKRNNGALGCKSEGGKTGIGSRRIFPPHFKLQVLDSYRNDSDCKGNQRATARKYGIHRRQIQKWLQAENNLRNSVGKGKSECSQVPEARKCGIDMALRGVEPRQRDDFGKDAYCDARVPAISPVAYPAEEQISPLISSATPLDYTTHSRVHTSPVSGSPVPSRCDPATPMDLSLKRTAPVYYPPSPLTHYSPSPPRIQSPITLTCLTQNQADVWDLSIKSSKRKCEESLCSPSSTSSGSSSQPPKPVKLFKPYLDDVQEYSNHSDDQHKLEVLPPCCTQSLSYHPTVIVESCYNNNTYTLHELQPSKTCINYTYYHHPLPVKYPLYPTPECDLSPQYCTYEDTNLLELSPPLKQRQSYSLDFKLSAIECYYQDEYCRGNQRAVANKYNIHRRQVQKWLKQEDELRQRNESVKQMHVVG